MWFADWIVPTHSFTRSPGSSLATRRRGYDGCVQPCWLQIQVLENLIQLALTLILQYPHYGIPHLAI
jgi:hypothetical protein